MKKNLAHSVFSFNPLLMTAFFINDNPFFNDSFLTTGVEKLVQLRLPGISYNKSHTFNRIKFFQASGHQLKFFTQDVCLRLNIDFLFLSISAKTVLVASEVCVNIE